MTEKKFRKKRKKRAKGIEKAIRLTWESLESHLEWTYKKIPKRCGETHDFHKQAVRDYAKVIDRLAHLF